MSDNNTILWRGRHSCMSVNSVQCHNSNDFLCPSPEFQNHGTFQRRIQLVNLQCNVLLTRVPIVIAEPLVQVFGNSYFDGTKLYMLCNDTLTEKIKIVQHSSIFIKCFKNIFVLFLCTFTFSKWMLNT